MERAQVSLLAQARYDKGWSQEHLAERMGVSSVTVSRWEQGGSTPHQRHLVQLCKIFNKTPQELGFGISQSLQRQQNAEIPDTDDGKETSYVTWRSQTPYARLMNIIWNWPRTARYHELQMLISLEYEDNMTENPIDRRNALFLLVSLTVEACTSTVLRNLFKFHPEEILTQSAAGITACWQLRKGKELAFVFDAVSKYVPALKNVIESAPDAERRAAADLLAQCYLLKASLAKHVTTNDDAIRFAKIAEQYAKAAQNSMLHILAVRRLAAAQFYANACSQALASAKAAQYLLKQAREPMPLLLQSYIHAGVATFSAYNQEKQEALSALGKAHETFFAQANDEDAPPWIDHSKANLVLNDALTHMHLGLSKEAFDSFGQVIDRDANSEVIRVEAMINQVVAEVTRNDQPRDMDFAIDRWMQSISEAVALKSEQWFRQAVAAHVAMCAAWPGEQKIRTLRQHIKHW